MSADVFQVEGYQRLLEGRQPANAVVETPDVLLKGGIRLACGDGEAGEVLLHDSPPAMLCPQVIEAGVDRHPVHPGGQAAATLKGGEAAPDADRHLLADVLAIVVVADVAAGDAINPVPVGLDHCLELGVSIHGKCSWPLDDAGLAGVTVSGGRISGKG